MEYISNMIGTAASYITTIGLADAVDILIVAWLIYKAVMFLRKTNSRNVGRTILLLALVFVVSYVFGLTMINFLMRKAMELGLIVIVILFQPELRSMLEKVGRSLTATRGVSIPAMETAIAQTVLACGEMSESRTGALMVFERTVDLSAIMASGTLVNADPTAELIKNLFYNKAPLHDGAVIVREGRIAAAGCVLPLTKSHNLSKDLGMRHRAGIGMSENSDAVVIIVSEETGAISVAIDGMLKRHLNTASLTQILHSELVVEQEPPKWTEQVKSTLRKWFRLDRLSKRDENGKENTPKKRL